MGMIEKIDFLTDVLLTVSLLKGARKGAADRRGDWRRRGFVCPAGTLRGEQTFIFPL